MNWEAEVISLPCGSQCDWQEPPTRLPLSPYDSQPAQERAGDRFKRTQKLKVMSGAMWVV